jgi:hypothetical protein
MANRVHPTLQYADNSSGSMNPSSAAACNDWRRSDADSFGATDHNRVHFRCQIYDCRYFPPSQTIDQPLAFVGESI